MSIKAIKVQGKGSLSRKSKMFININRNYDDVSDATNLEPFSGLSKFNLGAGINL